jgi:hypothetical protein
MQQDDDEESRYILSKTRVLGIDIVLSYQSTCLNMAFEEDVPLSGRVSIRLLANGNMFCTLDEILCS